MTELNNTGITTVGSTGWSEIDANNNSPAPDGWTSGSMLPIQVEPTSRGMMGAIKRFWDRINGTITSAGSAGLYSYAPVSGAYPVAYSQGEIYTFKANFTSVGGDSLNINGLGALGLYKAGVNGMLPLVAGDIQIGQFVFAAYDSALNAGAGGFQVIGVSAAAAISQQVLTAVLPAQAGNATAFVMTNGTTANWAYLISDPWVFYSMNAALRAIAFSQ